MIPQNTTIVAIAIVALLTTTTQAFEFFTPFSECNQQQSKIMKTKCEPLSGKAYTACERETLQQFFKCVQVGKDGK